MMNVKIVKTLGNRKYCNKWDFEIMLIIPNWGLQNNINNIYYSIHQVREKWDTRMIELDMLFIFYV